MLNDCFQHVHLTLCGDPGVDGRGPAVGGGDARAWGRGRLVDASPACGGHRRHFRPGRHAAGWQ